MTGAMPIAWLCGEEGGRAAEGMLRLTRWIVAARHDRRRAADAMKERRRPDSRGQREDECACDRDSGRHRDGDNPSCRCGIVHVRTIGRLFVLVMRMNRRAVTMLAGVAIDAQMRMERTRFRLEDEHREYDHGAQKTLHKASL
jgi:hypothetical protein